LVVSNVSNLFFSILPLTHIFQDGENMLKPPTSQNILRHMFRSSDDFRGWMFCCSVSLPKLAGSIPDTRQCCNRCRCHIWTPYEWMGVVFDIMNVENACDCLLFLMIVESCWIYVLFSCAYVFRCFLWFVYVATSFIWTWLNICRTGADKAPCPESQCCWNPNRNPNCLTGLCPSTVQQTILPLFVLFLCGKFSYFEHMTGVS
jgi:hypothetical protein